MRELSELTPEKIEAISEHEHIPEIVAAELAQTLLKSPRDVAQIKRFIHEDTAKAARLEAVYCRFDTNQPAPRA